MFLTKKHWGSLDGILGECARRRAGTERKEQRERAQGREGETRNWDSKTRDPKTVNLPWHALSFVVGGQRYTCCYIDRPQNPKEARYSERDYGRFGSYFEYTLDQGKPLDLNYRIWLQEGEMAAEDVQRLANDFVEPPTATVK